MKVEGIHSFKRLDSYVADPLKLQPGSAARSRPEECDRKTISTANPRIPSKGADRAVARVSIGLPILAIIWTGRGSPRITSILEHKAAEAFVPNKLLFHIFRAPGRLPHIMFL